MADLTTIQLTRETQAKLLALGKKGDTYEDVILRLFTPAPGKAKTRLGRPRTHPATTISSKLAEKHNP